MCVFTLGEASELGRQISADPKTPGGPGSCSTIAEEAVDQLQENEKLVAGEWCYPESHECHKQQILIQIMCFVHCTDQGVPE